MNVQVTHQAQLELNEVWRYNAEHHGARWADDYLDFLNDGIARLAAEHAYGRSIEGFPALRSMTFRRRAGGDGHLANYEVDPSTRTISVLHVFHTKQDVSGRLSGER